MTLCLIARPCDPADRSSRITEVTATQFAAIAGSPFAAHSRQGELLVNVRLRMCGSSGPVP
jgi:hypothetical protein